MLLHLDNYYFDSKSLLFFSDTIPFNKIHDISKQHIPDISENKGNTQVDKLRILPVTEIGICLTRNCNFRCRYCIDSAMANNVSVTESEVETYIKEMIKFHRMYKIFINKNAKLKIYLTGGGEQTSKWDLFRNSVMIIKRICAENKIDYSLGLTTNGYLDNFQREFIKNNINKVMISYDGLEEIQNKNRIQEFGLATNTKVIETIQYFINHQIDTEVRTTVCNEDFCNMHLMLDYLITSIGKNFTWSICPVLPLGRAKDFKNINSNSFFEHYIYLQEYAKKNYNFHKINELFFPKQIIDSPCGAVSTNYQCPWLLPEKEIVTCIESNIYKTILGKIDNNKIVWNEQITDVLLTTIRNRMKECKDCLAFRFCRGGCPIRALSNKGSNEWECTEIIKYMKYIFHELLKNGKIDGWILSEAIPGKKEILKIERDDYEENSISK